MRVPSDTGGANSRDIDCKCRKLSAGLDHFYASAKVLLVCVYVCARFGSSEIGANSARLADLGVDLGLPYIAILPATDERTWLSPPAGLPLESTAASH